MFFTRPFAQPFSQEQHAITQPCQPGRCIGEQAQLYATWLTEQARRHSQDRTAGKSEGYAQHAMKTVIVRGKRISIFAPFRPEYSALQTITRNQAFVLGLLYLASLVALLWQPWAVLQLVIAVITLIYLSHLVLSIYQFMRRPGQSMEQHIDDTLIDALKSADWPCYTILCPLYREAKIVPQFIRAMKALDYPTEKLQILLLTEKDDVETRTAIHELSLPPHFHVVTVPQGTPRTKPRACNFGLMHAHGEYTVIYDAEDVPEPMQLKKAVLTFANHGPELACVQAKLNFYNPDKNILTRWFTAEYSLWFDLMLPALQRTNFSLPLGGTSNHFRTETLRALGAWDAFNVTEDCDLGLRLAHHGFKTAIIDSMTYEEANPRFKNWLRQRSRWIKGYMQTYLVHMRRPLRYMRKGQWGELLSLQLIVGGKTAVLFLNPLMWLLFVLYIALRPFVGDVYHQLFPAPILYAGGICLIAGNFFYVYLYLYACFKRKLYGLLKWALLIPCYWMMMSAAACMALYQLIVKPHYWEKTEHGFGSPGKTDSTYIPWMRITSPLTTDDEPTLRLPAIPTATKQPGPVPSVTALLQTITTLPLPVYAEAQHARGKRRHTFTKDPWLTTTVIIACLLSAAVCCYFFQQHDILLYKDAYSHLRIARRIFDSITPGISQFGGIWLPLPHALMLPFAWNDFLWHTGLAGSLASMPCYALTAAYLYRAARRLTHNGCASCAGTLLFLLNPNILYLQTTPLSEPACIATITATCYYFLAWIQDDEPGQLVRSAGCVFLATLARYDGWALFFCLLLLIVIIGWMKHQKRAQIGAQLILFGTLGILGITLWLLWNQVIFGNLLFFQQGIFSSQAQQALLLHTDALYTYHDLWQSLRYYTITVVQTLGPMSFGLTCLSLLAYLLRRRFAPEAWGTLAWLVPFGFYVLALYGGQAAIFVPGAVPASAFHQLFNVRYGAEMVAPAALFLATGIASASRLFGRIGRCLVPTCAAALMLLQAGLLASGGIITLQDGLYGLSCEPQHMIVLYLAQHYAGGKILEDAFTADIDGLDAGIDLRNFISEDSGNAWTNALRNPANMVDWIVVHPGQEDDLVAQQLARVGPKFLAQFTLMLQEPHGLRLYHRNGRPLTNRLLAIDTLSAHRLCDPFKPH